MPYAYDMAVNGYALPLDTLLIATDGYIRSAAAPGPGPGPAPAPAPGPSSSASPSYGGGGGNRPLRYVPGEGSPDQTDELDESLELEEDLPLKAAFAVAEQISDDVPHKDLVFRLAWLMRKRRR